MQGKEESKRHGTQCPRLIWLLVLVLIALVGVPFLAMGIALEKSGWIRRSNFSGSELSLHRKDTEPHQGAQDPGNDLADLRVNLEKTVGTAIGNPKIGTQMHEIRIEAAKESESDMIRKIDAWLESRKLGHLDSKDQDVTRILVLLPRKDWPGLAGQINGITGSDGAPPDPDQPESRESSSSPEDCMLGVIMISTK